MTAQCRLVRPYWRISVRDAVHLVSQEFPHKIARRGEGSIRIFHRIEVSVKILPLSGMLYVFNSDYRLHQPESMLISFDEREGAKPR